MIHNSLYNNGIIVPQDFSYVIVLLYAFDSEK